ncbi:unnamed protein product [Polarella glacialis]|uniref:Uncharacterized protein n=1 Tax=Polarella glacialis TaxID=89957 RepID=A0A813G2V6_POLGL|nr:unnamed protein product [Polarella glacialis]
MQLSPKTAKSAAAVSWVYIMYSASFAAAASADAAATPADLRNTSTYSSNNKNNNNDNKNNNNDNKNNNNNNNGRLRPSTRRVSMSSANYSSLQSCSLHGQDCRVSTCCDGQWDTCFARDSLRASCQASCVPGAAKHSAGGEEKDLWRCQTPFEDPRAQARQTETWPHITAVCSPGVALVEPDMFRSRYRSSCQEFCVNGAGRSVRSQGDYNLWVSVDWPTDMVMEPGCPGEKEGHHEGVRCECSFPDRL